MIARPAADRFWEKVEKDGPSDCWNWTGTTGGSGYHEGLGYGALKVEGKMVKAHRFAYELLVAPIPDGLVIDHLCRNRQCVNPAHLEAVTFRENILRGEGACAQHARKTHCPKGHPYSPDNTYIKPSDNGRLCRTCQRERQAVVA